MSKKKFSYKWCSMTSEVKYDFHKLTALIILLKVLIRLDFNKKDFDLIRTYIINNYRLLIFIKTREM